MNNRFVFVPTVSGLLREHPDDGLRSAKTVETINALVDRNLPFMK